MGAHDSIKSVSMSINFQKTMRRKVIICKQQWSEVIYVNQVLANGDREAYSLLGLIISSLDIINTK